MPHSRLLTDERKPTRTKWHVPVGLAVALTLYNLLLNPIHGSASDSWVVNLCIGVLFVQPFLLATWAALGPGNVVLRLPISAALLVAWILAMSLADWNLLANKSARREMNIEMSVAFVAVFAIASAILGLVRRISGLRLMGAALVSQESERGRHQFGMKYLLGWMTACALLMVVGRSFIPDTIRANQPWRIVFWNLAVVGGFLMFVTMPPAILPLLSLTRPPPWRSLLIVVVAWPILLWAGVEVINLNTRGGPPRDIYWVFGCVQIGAMLTALSCVGALRLGGFHLTRAIDSDSNRT